MFSYCYFCSDKDQSPCTGYLSSPLSLFFRAFWTLFLAFLYSFAPSFSYRLFFKIPPLITEVENISGYPGFFSETILPKYLTGCVSHCCIVGGNHAIYVYVIIPQVDEWCKFPTYCCLECACHILALLYLSSPLSLFSGPFRTLFLVFLYSFAYFFSIPPLLQNPSTHHRGRKHLWLPRVFFWDNPSQVSHWLCQSLSYCMW